MRLFEGEEEENNFEAQINNFYFLCFNQWLSIKNHLLTAKVKTLTKNAQTAKNHCALQTDNGATSSSLLIASKLMIDMGITKIVTNKSVNPILTIRLFPVMHWK